jgi:hypothetical protein
VVPLIRLLVLLTVSAPVFACDYPDLGNLPLRRAVSKVKYLPETEAWASAMRKAGAVVQYALLLEESRQEHGRCYWPVEVRAAGSVWRRFWVSPDGRSVLRPAARAPRPATPPPGSTAEAR